MRMFIKWSEKMSCGIAEIDEQHKVLIDLINKIHKSFLDNTNQPVVDDILAELAQYTIMHFMVEDNLMRILKYAHYEAHKEQHDLFTGKVFEFKARIKETNKSVSYELLDFLRDWLIQHILTEDKNLTSALLDKYIKRS